MDIMHRGWRELRRKILYVLLLFDFHSDKLNIWCVSNLFRNLLTIAKYFKPFTNVNGPWRIFFMHCYQNFNKGFENILRESKSDFWKIIFINEYINEPIFVYIIEICISILINYSSDDTFD